MLMMNMYFLLFFYLLRVEYQVRLIFSDVREKEEEWKYISSSKI